MNVPAGVIGLTLGWLLLPRSRSRRPIDGADRLGALLLALAAAGPLVYLSLATSHGYDDVALLLALGAGLLAAVGFVLRERVTAAPLIDLSILRRPALSTGLSSGLMSYLVLFGTLYVVPYYLSAKDVRPALIGLQLAVLPVALGIAALIAGRLLSRVGDRPLTAGGLILAAAGMLEIALWHGTTGLFAGLAITGFGLGAFTPANNATIMSASPAGHTGVVSGMLNMTRGIGTALGVAVAGALYTAAAAANGANASRAGLTAAESGLTLALAVLGLIALATSLALLLSARREAHPVDGRDDGRGSASAETPTASVDPHEPTAANSARPHRQRMGHPLHAGQFGSRRAPTLESPEGESP